MEFITNKQGAKIYRDINKHKFLVVPKIESTSEDGKTYQVLAVGFNSDYKPLVTVKEGSKAIAYRLPEGLSDWAVHTVALARQGIKALPCDIEFGELPDGCYAEII